MRLLYTETTSWLKVKCIKRQDFVIVGYTDSEKGLPGFGALILGVYEGDRLVYAGRVGTGFRLKQRADIRQRLDPLYRERSALALIPKTLACERRIGSNRNSLLK